MSEHDTYLDRSEFLAEAKAPEYQTSARYRGEVEAKLARSLAAGTITPMGERITHGEGGSYHTRIATHTEEAIYGGVQPMPGADPLWAEAGKVGTGYFEGPEAIAMAMGAPQYELDAGYRQAVSDKIGRSIREGFISVDLQPLDPSRRFAR